jgi:hypothetical protein
VWECESCSRPGAYRPAAQSTHRYSCQVEGVKQVGKRLLVTCTSDRYAGPDIAGAGRPDPPDMPAQPVMPAEPVVAL